MDTSAVEGCGAADACTSLILHPEELTEEVQPSTRCKSVDPSEGVNGARLKMAAGSVPTESHDAISAAPASARAAVVASTVSSMTALVAAVTFPSARQCYPRCFSSGSSFLQKAVHSEARSSRRTSASSSPRSGVSAGGFLSPFHGYAPWPKEGRDDGDDGDESENEKSSEGATAGSTDWKPTGLFRKCGYPGGCDNVATHAPPRLLLRGPVAAPDIKVEPSTAASTESSCPSSAVTPKAKGKSDVVEGSSHRSDNGDGDAGAGGVTTEAGSGDGANSSSSIPAEATEAVRASDGVGSAATAAINGKSETAADPSGASSSGAVACSVVEKDVSSGDGEAGVPSTDVDTSTGVRQPTRCLEHAGPGWVNVCGEDNAVGGLEGKGKAKAAMGLGGDGIDDEGTGGDEGELSPASLGGGMKGRYFGKTKGVNGNCPHPHSKHYCRGKCKLCYMKEYNRKTRALNGGIGKASQKPAADKGASSEGDVPSSPEGGAGAAPFVGLRKRRRPEAETETNDSSSKEITVTDKSWRKTISSCEHTDAPHYGKGFCRPCYMREYHRAKKKGGEVVRLPAPPRAEVGSKSSEVKGSLSSGSKEADASGGKAGASAPRGRARAAVVARTAAAVAGGGGGVSSSTRGLSIAVPKTTALPPPLCGVCGQTEKAWRLVLICDGCGESFHLGCQGLGNQPFGEWFCPSCTEILLDSDSDIEDRSDFPETGLSASSTPRRARSVKLPLTGDVRGCRCPICVSILLQSGCSRPAKLAGALTDTRGGDAEDAKSMRVKTEAPGSPAIKSLKARVRNSPSSGKAGDAKAETKKRSGSRSGDLSMSSDKGEVSAAPAAVKRTKVSAVAASKTSE